MGAVSSVSVRRVRRGDVGGATWGLAAAALQPRGDRDGDDAVGGPGAAAGTRSRADLRLSERGVGHGVVDPSAMGPRGACAR